MGRLTLRAAGAAPPETVWRRYACVDQWSRWSPQIKAVHTEHTEHTDHGEHQEHQEHADSRTLVPGLSGTVESVAGIRAAFVVDHVDPDRRAWTWRVRCGPARLLLRHEVRATPDGSSTRLTMRGPLPVLVAYAPLARLALRRLVRP